MASSSSPYAREYQDRLVTADDAVLQIKSGSTVAVAMAHAQPPALLAALAQRVRSGDLKELKVIHKISMSHMADTLFQPDVIEKIRTYSLFQSALDRSVIKRQRESGGATIDYLPCNFYQMPRMMTEFIKIDTLIATLSPMDRHGHFTLGTNNDWISPLIHRCGQVIVEVNEQMPRVFGDSLVHISEVNAVVENHAPLLEFDDHPPQPEDEAIGRAVAELVPDGATLQMGIGGIPNAIAGFLESHRDLGIHTEVFATGVMNLIRKGIATGRKKAVLPRKHVFTITLANREVFEFINDNPSIESHPSSFVNDPVIIAENDKVISINSAIEVDLLGQVNAESLGGSEFSGSGGAHDFMRGAFRSHGGRSIMALYSTAKKGTISRIVPSLSIVTDPRNDTEYVVTEHGVTNLKGKSVRERAEALIGIAHPRFREELTSKAKEFRIL
ncbi:MAG: acetyl-CoA hydrolase/transferase C-terminal domain-containing protein [Candidatus Eremiobacteraeota bacterium]|nr:acetyl-CoA hydrolase/transferase C-terminal domain-containing protein [Candidatus Eremiobacteraeota bacterium]